MIWEGRPLREITEADIRTLVESGLEEHLQLEYKRELYEDNDAGRREFVLDIGMFANTAGGVLLIGIAERRDDNGQPTGTPDPAALLGMEIPNPEAILSAYDARIMEAIEERLPVESAAIPVGNGHTVLAMRVPNSPAKPHSVRRERHIYFPARRERQRYGMNVREIKELVMRMASQLQRAEELLKNYFEGISRANGEPYLVCGLVPVFFQDFLVDVQSPALYRAFATFSRAGNQAYRDPSYTFDGLLRTEDSFDYRAVLWRNGLLGVSLQSPLYRSRGDERVILDPRVVEAQLRRFVRQASDIYQVAGLTAPFILSVSLQSAEPIFGAFPDFGLNTYYVAGTPVVPGAYRFPYLQAMSLSDGDHLIRPLCDLAHQMFGKEGSPSFDVDGRWAGIPA